VQRQHKNQWLNCSNSSIKWKLGKTGNEDMNEIVWEWFVRVRAKNFRISGPMVQDLQKKWLKNWGK
jgi:hypothetical protein